MLNVGQAERPFGVAAASGSVTPVDPYFANVVLLAGNESGADGTTTFLDQSSYGRTLTAVGNAQWDTAQAPTGLTSSILLDGSDRLTTPAAASLDMTNQNFAVETRVRFAVDPGTGLVYFFGQVDSTTGAGSWIFYLQNNNLRFYYTTAGTFASSKIASGTWNPAADTWYDLTAARDGADLRLYVGDAQVGTTFNASTDTIYSEPTRVLSLGASSDSAGFVNGWMASTRLTIGANRGYTGTTITVPTLPLPTS